MNVFCGELPMATLDSAAVVVKYLSTIDAVVTQSVDTLSYCC